MCCSLLIKKFVSPLATAARGLTAWTVAIFFTLSLFVTAGTVSVPQDDPIATVRFPNKWKVDVHPEYVEAVPPDRATHLMVLPVEGRKVAESVGEAIRYIRRTGAILIKPDSMKNETTTVKGRQLRRLSWDAVSSDQAIIIRCHVVPVADGKQLLVIFWGSPEAEKKYRSELNNVFESLRAAEGS
jgi:hypothetical protein